MYLYFIYCTMTPIIFGIKKFFQKNAFLRKIQTKKKEKRKAQWRIQSRYLWHCSNFIRSATPLPRKILQPILAPFLSTYHFPSVISVQHYFVVLIFRFSEFENVSSSIFVFP